MPFSPCKHHITIAPGQVVPSVLAASLPDTSGRARQQAEASRTAGTVTARPLGQQGGMAAKDTIDNRQAGKEPGQNQPGRTGCARAFEHRKEFFLIS